MVPTAGSEPPQVGAGTAPISPLTLSVDADRVVQAAVEPLKRRLDRKNPAPARGRLYYWVSRRGLTHALIIDPACSWCGEVHTYRAAGLRIASCGGGYVQIKARKARGTKAAA